MTHTHTSFNSRFLYGFLFAIISLMPSTSIASPWSMINKEKNLLILDINTLKQSLLNTPLRAKSTDINPPSIMLPLPNGDEVKVNITPNHLLPPLLANHYPHLRTWDIKPNKHHITGTLDITEQGFHAMLMMPNGKMVFIDPTNQAHQYQSRYRHSPSKQGMACQTKHSQKQHQSTSILSAKAAKTSDSLVTYRLAIAATYPYTKHHGSKAKAMSAIVTTVNRINSIYQRDLGIRFVLVENNDQLVFDNRYDDPFFFYLNWPSAMLTQNKETINQIIGEKNYDIGHVFSQGEDAGLASAYSTCTEEKSSGYTSSNKPSGDLFDIDFVAHEIGHQVGADHSFNSETVSCGGGNRMQEFAVEPGSGSTIMGYAGLCGINDIQVETDAVFHISSINVIKTFIQKGAGKRCGTRSNINNQVPTITDKIQDYYIPIQTPFTLTTQATDTDSNQSLTYSWDQVDTGAASSAIVDMGNNAILRTLPPSTNNSRDFPSIAAQQSHLPIAGEIIPMGERNINFKRVVRDGHSGIASQDITVHTVDSESGKLFAITSHPKLQANSTIKIKWNTANTEKSPINCSTINLALSIDSGKTFPFSLANDIANTGSTQVTLPNLTFNQQSRLKISCHQGIFFSVTRSSQASEANATAAINTVPNYLNADNSSRSSRKKKGSLFSPLIIISLLFIAYFRQRSKP